MLFCPISSFGVALPHFYDTNVPGLSCPRTNSRISRFKSLDAHKIAEILVYTWVDRKPLWPSALFSYARLYFSWLGIVWIYLNIYSTTSFSTPQLCIWVHFDFKFNSRFRFQLIHLMNLLARNLKYPLVPLFCHGDFSFVTYCLQYFLCAIDR